MESNLDKYKQDLERLRELGATLAADLVEEIEDKKPKKDQLKPGSLFMSTYQKWYTQAQEVMKQILPSRYDEFIVLYKETKRKELNSNTFGIQDWLLGTRAPMNDYTMEKRYNDIGIVFMKFQTQMGILNSATLKFTSSLLNIKQLLQADLFDSETEVARELLKKGFMRAAGAIAGVILERHLNNVCISHNVPINKKKPTISDFNDALKEANVIELHQWRFIQHLGDLRNLCDHNKDREPKPEEVAELIDGVEKTMKTIF